MIKIGFFGTPEIASKCLEGLFDTFEISFVVTAEDKPSGRNQRIAICPAKETALAKGLPVFQPGSLRDQDFAGRIKGFDADIYVVVAYGKLIPRDIFDHPPLKTINLHPSLLPKYRGAAPIPWSIIRGEKETGVTVQLINDKLDAGDIIIQEKIRLHDDSTSGELYKAVIPMGINNLARAIELLYSGKAVPIKQNEADATYCGKIDRETGRINWNLHSRQIHNLVRGLNPKPVAWTNFRNKNIRIWKTSLFIDDPGISLKPGQLALYQKRRLLAGTGDGCVEILSLQPETKKIIDALPFINGYRLNTDDRFDV